MGPVTVYINGQMIGTAASVQEASTLAHKMAAKIRGNGSGAWQAKFYDKNGIWVGSANGFVG